MIRMGRPGIPIPGDSIGFRIIFSIILIVGLLYIPTPAFSQDSPNIQNLILNGGFEEGFQSEFGIGYGWGGFSNGNATVGWNADTWQKVVIAGQNAQMIEIKNATERDRYAGIYQTVSVVPGQQYKLAINGLVRSDEGDIQLSDYGYRLQYAVDYEGGTAWELIDNEAWGELPWDEQPLYDSLDETYRFDTFETTLTARGDKLTLFIRGWKKWINNGSGIFNLDEISLVGPAPEDFQAPVPQAASVSNSAAPAGAEPVTTDTASQVSEQKDEPTSAQAPVDEATSQTEVSSQTEDSPQTNASSQPAEVPKSDTASSQPEAAPQTETVSSQPEASAGQTEPASPSTDASQLPVSGRGSDDSVNYIIISGAVLLLVLFGGAVAAIMRQRNPVE